MMINVDENTQYLLLYFIPIRRLCGNMDMKDKDQIIWVDDHRFQLKGIEDVMGDEKGLVPLPCLHEGAGRS